MRKIIWCSALAASLLAAGACKDRDERMQKTGKAVEKSAEKVEEQKDELKDKTHELTKERDEMNEAQREHAEKLREVEKQEGEVTAAEGAELRAREDYERMAKDHLARIDIKIRELEGRADAKSTELAQSLRLRRDELANKVDSIKTRTSDGWDDFKGDVDKSFEKLDKDLDAATRGEKLPPVVPKDPPPASR